MNTPQFGSKKTEKKAHPIKIYSYYRFVISCLFFTTIFLKKNASEIHEYNVFLFMSTASGYLILTIGTIIYTHLKFHISHLACFFVVASDVLIIATLAHASGGISNDASILLIVTIAAGSIMTRARMATTIAALATLIVLFEHVYFSYSSGRYDTSDSVHAGLLGTSFFITSFLIQSIAKRLRESEQLTAVATSALAELEALNRQIIQRMRTGILVIDPFFKIKMMNESAQNLISTSSHINNDQLKNYSSSLYDIVQAWQQTHDTPLQKVFKNSPQGPEIIASITHLNTEHTNHHQYPSYILIFLEDNSRMTQQALQLKLASLGQLTAAIAHEVRNPLGAISHAAQLLLESDSLIPADNRLAHIIQDHSIRVNQIIESVLSLSRRKSTDTRRFLLMPWLEKFIQEQKNPSTIKVNNIDPSMTVCFDPSQLTQVLTNLVENGLRYSQAHQIELVEITAGVEKKTNRPFLEVQDFGPGISPEQQQRLFEPFFTTETTGTGLGLYISKELCQAHQARLDFIPIEHVNQDQMTPEASPLGACFRITFSHPDKLLKS